MEKNCVYCNRAIYSDELHYKFGNAYVCAQCGAIHTIRDVCNVVDTDIRILPVTIEVDNSAETAETAETENSLSGKTESGDTPFIELDKSKIDANADSADAARNIYSQFHILDDEGEDIEWDDESLSKVVNRYGAEGENIPAHVKVNGYFRYFPDIVDPEDDTPDYWHDAENMSEEDYVSKYADNPDALDYWITANS